jgi:hypothetical protein
LIPKGAIIHNREGRVCLPDGLRVLNVPPGLCLADRVDRYYASMKPTQSYYGTFEEMEDKMHGSISQESTYVNQEIEERKQQIAKLEKEQELKERENALSVKQFKLEAKLLDKAAVQAYLLEHFDKDLQVLSGRKLGFQ